MPRINSLFILAIIMQALRRTSSFFLSFAPTTTTTSSLRHRTNNFTPRNNFRVFSSSSSSTTAADGSGGMASGGGSTSSTSFSSAASPSAQRTFEQVFGGNDKRPVVLFDGICAFCNKGIDTLLTLDIYRKLRFAPLQSQLGKDLMSVCGRDPEDLSSMLVVEQDKRLSIKSDAALRIAEVAAPHPLLGSAFEKAARLLFPQGMRDSAYDSIAENRYDILGKREECRLPDPGDDRFLA
jgi:predicted DCC family thiol-disulfide oxidoreductase YuxK